MTQRWKLTLEYHGADFVGWQRQGKGVSVQQCLEEAVRAFCGETVSAQVAGRTDSGVHATGQVAHIDLEKEFEEKRLRDGINFHLHPHRAAIVKAEPVSTDFHARFSALRRVYCYKILMARGTKPVIGNEYMWHVWQDMDIARMNEAAQTLLGTHDFSSFRDSQCQAKSPVRTLDRLDCVEKQDVIFGRHLEIWAEAKSFLHHQIRNITGTLKMVGEGKWTAADVKTALDSRDRTAAGPTAPAHGLYFVRVDY